MINLLQPLGIKELIRTGRVAIARDLFAPRSRSRNGSLKSSLPSVPGTICQSFTLQEWS